MQEFDAQPLSDDRYELGECCRWDDERGELSWVDVPAGRFFRARTSGELTIVRTYQVEGFLSATAPFEDRSKGWIVAVNQSIAHLHESGALDELARPEARNAPLVRMNDGACDPWGRFLIGSMALDITPQRGSLYRYRSGSDAPMLFSNVTVSNGIGWSPDRRTMYYVDSGPGTIHAFQLDDTGELGEKTLLLRFDPLHVRTPDGLCVDEEGCLWVAFWDGGEVCRFAPSGEQLARVALPVSRPTSCALGGASGTVLYITTACEGLSESRLSSEADAGRLFHVDVGVRGLPINPFVP
ncbi:MAG: SMP-30/gluconolactonase/LRE family protein [Acidimicrobiales bacterium]